MKESEFIKNTVADYFRVPIEGMESGSRKRELVRARHIAMDCFILLTDLTLSKIGKEFNGKDHASIIFACKSVNNQAYYYPEYRYNFKELLSKLGWYNTEFSRYENYDTDKI